MIINKVSATFGKLSGESLEFKDGLNVVCAPNESGKSTWCAFIRAMLYGIDSSERQKAGYLPDKTRYAPWSGAAMQGSMEVNVGGRDICISRTTKQKNYPMREFSAEYAGTNVAVEGLNSANCGEALTGVSRDVFRRSAFVEQDGIGVSASPELEKRIATIVSTGEEGCSYSEADERLRIWLRKRRYRRSGMLPELEDGMDAEKRRLEELYRFADEREALSEKLSESLRRCDSLEREMLESRKTARKDALSALHDARSERKAAEEDCTAAQRRCADAREKLCDDPLYVLDPKPTQESFDADSAELTKLSTEAKRKVSVLPAVCVLVLALICAAVAVMTEPLLLIAAGVLALLCVLIFVRIGKRKQTVRESQRKKNAILERYSAQTPEEMERSFLRYTEKLSDCRNAEKSRESAEQRLRELTSRLEKTESETLSILDFAEGDSTAAYIGRQLAAERQLCDSISARLNELKGAAAAVGDPLVIGSRLMEMQDEYREINAEYEAISLAVETLKDADAEIQSRFSPALGKLAAEYFSRMTGGKYDGLLINRDFSVKVRENGASVAVDTAYLSAGTEDLMYLAVRLAVCRLALPETAVCPLILDDTLANLDPERTAAAMSLLREIAKERQVILFTCRDPE